MTRREDCERHARLIIEAAKAVVTQREGQAHAAGLGHAFDRDAAYNEALTSLIAKALRKAGSE